LTDIVVTCVAVPQCSVTGVQYELVV